MLRDSPSSGKHLKLVPEKHRLYPKFQSYKLESYSDETLVKRIPLHVPPSRPVLPNNARVGFQDVRVRTRWNHLSRGWEGHSVLYVGAGGEIVRIQEGQATTLTKIPLGTRQGVYGYYADVVEIGVGLLIATDGLGQLSLIRDGAVLASLQEDIPFVIFDAKVMEDEIYVLLCQGQDSSPESSTSKAPKGEYVLRKFRLSVSSTLEYAVLVSLSGSEIPKHAVLTPDILLVTQSPFRVTSAAMDLDLMDLDNEAQPPPLYTYFQTPTDLDISVPLPLNTPKSAIKINFSTSTLQLYFLPPKLPKEPDLSETFPFQTAEEKPLWGTIDPMSSTWTLSSTSSSKVLDIHLEKLPDQSSRWPQVFEDPDGAEEYTDPSDRRDMLERLEKYTQSSTRDDSQDTVHRRFLLEEDEDIDSVDQGDMVQFFQESKVLESYNHDLLATPFDGETIGVKVSIDMCVFDVIDGHTLSVPAFNFVASSKRLRKYCRYTDEFAMIVESGRGGNMYVYYLPENGVTAKQLVIRVGVDSLGIGLIKGEGVVIIGDGEKGPEAVVVGGL